MDQEVYSPASTPMQASPRSSCIQEVSWPLPLASLHPHLRRLSHMDRKILRNTSQRRRVPG